MAKRKRRQNSTTATSSNITIINNNNNDNDNKDNTCRILIVTDIHERMDRIECLRRSILKAGREVDLIICCGDLLNIQHKNASPPNTAPQHKELLEALLDKLRAICPHVFYLPGNHDPAEEFTVTSQAANGDRPAAAAHRAFNFHRQVIPLAKQLLLAGIGGSTDSFYYHSSTINGGTTLTGVRPVYTGFPYTDGPVGEDLLGEHLELLAKQIATASASASASTARNQHQVLIITHIGPAGTGTVDVNPRPLKPEHSRIEAGSRAVRDFLLNSKLNLLANIHGHSHQPWGISQLGTAVTVINPGPLRDGRYCEVELQFDGIRWLVESINMRCTAA